VNTGVLDNGGLAQELRAHIRSGCQRLAADSVFPTLSVIACTPDPTSIAFAQSFSRFGESLGLRITRRVVHPPDAPRLIDIVREQAADPAVHGVLCLAPFPAGISLQEVGAQIPLAKDVDGSNPESLGLTALGLGAFAPAVAQATIDTLWFHQVRLAGAAVTLLGYNTYVDVALVSLLSRANATVTTLGFLQENRFHSTTADIVITHVNQPRSLTELDVRPGAVVVDLGYSVEATVAGDVQLGDVATESVARVARVIPAPGRGVRWVSSLILMRNTIAAAAVVPTQRRSAW
jgi:methylenetetrahydrofolate dehydrogenase (NADP+)/methenyltetrahydrofolate cyclohydrolase